jgi:hypothetical protein
VTVPGSPPFLSVRWRRWAEGGTTPGGAVYYGMQTLVDMIRDARPRGFGAHNLIFADGIEFAKTLEDVDVLKDPANALAYAFHPYSTESWMTVEQWQKDWTTRFLNPSRSRNIPVVVTEWFARPDLMFDVWNSFTPQRIVALLQFLKDNEIGFYPFTFDILGWLTVNFTDRPTSIFGPNGVLPPAGPGMQFGVGKAVFYYYTRGVTDHDRRAVKVPTVNDL